jgi:hypothetical protein
MDGLNMLGSPSIVKDRQRAAPKSGALLLLHSYHELVRVHRYCRRRQTFNQRRYQQIPTKIIRDYLSIAKAARRAKLHSSMLQISRDRESKVLRA